MATESATTATWARRVDPRRLSLLAAVLLAYGNGARSPVDLSDGRVSPLGEGATDARIA
jgi:hypothetical protein